MKVVVDANFRDFDRVPSPLVSPEDHIPVSLPGQAADTGMSFVLVVDNDTHEQQMTSNDTTETNSQGCPDNMPRKDALFLSLSNVTG